MLSQDSLEIRSKAASDPHGAPQRPLDPASDPHGAPPERLPDPSRSTLDRTLRQSYLSRVVAAIKESLLAKPDAVMA